MRAALDRGFRARLLSDPRDAIRELGFELPANFRLRFIEKDHDLDLLVVLPDLLGGEPLGPDELDAVRGGANRLPWTMDIRIPLR